MERRDSFIPYIQYAIRDNWNRLALSDFEGINLQYRDVARKIAKLHLLYDKVGIQPGDRIAICGKNSAQWCVAFLSIVTYGATAVPILQDFHPDSIVHLINHSESRIFFCDKSIWTTLDSNAMTALECVVDIPDYKLLAANNPAAVTAREHLNMLFGDKYPDRFNPTDVVYKVPSPDSIAVINYTSGSTGAPKGVMLSHRAMWSNLQYCIDGLTFLKPGDGVVCMLPLAHMFGLTIDLLHCFAKGCHIHFLTRLPSPKVILGAFAQVKPKLIVAVPLIIEKIIKNKVFPQLKRPALRIALKTPWVKDIVLKRIRQNLINAFGGNLLQLIIGGASLSKDVESFLRKIDFPFTVGYGMTECGPLIAYAPWNEQRPQSCGRIVDRMEAKIDSPNPSDIPGVLWVKGDNVMSGYYKNPEVTAETFKDGWMCTGDICTQDADGFLYIKGRSKTMLLGPSGQNIYPEEIEQILNNLPYVAESLVIQDGDKLVALIYPDHENKEVQSMTAEQIDKAMEDNLTELNKLMPTYSKVTQKRILDKEFEKTPKRSIKRYLYQPVQ